MSKNAEVPILSRRVTEGGRAVVVEVRRPRLVDKDKTECVYRLADTRRISQGPDELTALYGALRGIGDLFAQANRSNPARFVVPANLAFPVTPGDARADMVDVADVVATQTITVDGEQHRITLYRPVESVGKDGMSCHFQLDDDPCAVAHGWDGIDAVLNAVAMIGARLRLPAHWPLSHAGA